MNLKLCDVMILLLATASTAAALEFSDADTHSLAIAFLVLCAIVLLVAVIIAIVIYRRVKQKVEGKSVGSKYNLEYRRTTKKNDNFSSVGVYGYYADPEPVGSIYLPLDREKRIEESNGYAYLKGKDNEGASTYENLSSSNSFTPKNNVYENPGTVINGDAYVDDDDSEHDYEMAVDPSVSTRGPAYENPPVKAKDAESSF